MIGRFWVPYSVLGVPVPPGTADNLHRHLVVRTRPVVHSAHVTFHFLRQPYRLFTTPSFEIPLYRCPKQLKVSFSVLLVVTSREYQPS